MSTTQDLIIYGAGGNGIKFFNSLKDNGYNIIFFLDLYSKKQEHNGIKIYRPHTSPTKNCTVLISVSCYSRQIADDLKEQGYNICLDFNQCLKRFPTLLNQFILPEKLLDCTNETKNNLNKIKNLNLMFKDEESKNALQRILAFRLAPSSKTYIENDWQVQYFPNDLPLSSVLKRPIVMLDCGAFTGDTLPIALSFFKKHKIDVSSISLFEPNLNNNVVLQEVIEKFTTPEYLLINYPCGVWSKNTILNFELGAETSHIVNTKSERSVQVPVVSLDAVAYGYQPNLIKMDVEGAEIEAIKGARKIIRQYRPTLAISVYHKASHLWEVAFLINDINPNYNYYLRTHGDLGNEIILYALPT
ncbi:FkbM family methyltransferase [Colwellia echini]|uniref:FkbM family methyltransferase n=1 Tax=Colwellia echini TaxID=1982103 RepID=A0ABY3MWL0_9GAMM|nr:FkbM family methyltransferase [Colwellia echini]TYK65595.1 FkbM family methyltransferase [Colwellia echini]